MEIKEDVSPAFDVTKFSEAALKVLIDQFDSKVKDLEERVDKAAENEDYDLAEELQEELELYQKEESEKVKLAKSRIEELQNSPEVQEPTEVEQEVEQKLEEEDTQKEEALEELNVKQTEEVIEQQEVAKEKEPDV